VRGHRQRLQRPCGGQGCTKAASGCGGCAALLKQVFEHELTARGVAVDKSLCEHFAYTRQELYGLVRGGHPHLRRTARTPRQGPRRLRHLQAGGGQYPRLVLEPADHGPGAGAAAGHQRHLHGQHAEERHLLGGAAHPGGEITPDKLIVIGQVAKKYDLYTKITGGQRIDLFGAQLHELPLIWGELIEAGFETGHAYGKSTRTVKSCVGSTWCRYGVQDSVAWPCAWRTATRACARRTSSSSRCPAAPASAPRRRARTSA
jgi:nitrite reductase (NADH) large subunit